MIRINVFSLLTMSPSLAGPLLRCALGRGSSAPSPPVLPALAAARQTQTPTIRSIGAGRAVFPVEARSAKPGCCRRPLPEQSRQTCSACFARARERAAEPPPPPPPPPAASAPTPGEPTCSRWGRCPGAGGLLPWRSAAHAQPDAQSLFASYPADAPAASTCLRLPARERLLQLGGCEDSPHSRSLMDPSTSPAPKGR